jgi:hypothetical protein
MMLLSCTETIIAPGGATSCVHFGLSERPKRQRMLLKEVPVK